MSTWIWLLVAILLAAAAYALVRYRRRSGSERATVDPVCGMAVSRSRAKATRLGQAGSPMYMCSGVCTEKFDADPARYGGMRPHHGAHMGC